MSFTFETQKAWLLIPEFSVQLLKNSMGCLQMPQGTGDLFALEAPVRGLWSLVSIDVIQERLRRAEHFWNEGMG